MTTKNENKKPIEVPIAWDALEDAFENNAPEVHSYLHVETGEVIRIVDGVADPAMHSRIMGDPNYLRIDPVSSREQYRWMERFITTVEDDDLQGRLAEAIDGKGAFRRFKDALMNSPVERERWFTFRSERLRVCMESWMTAHGIVSVERETWEVPTADEVKDRVETTERVVRRSRPPGGDVPKERVHALVDALSGKDLETAEAFMEFLRDRHGAPKAVPKGVEPVVTTIARRAKGDDL